MDRLALDRFALIGTSMGGIIAMAYIEAHAARLTALVLNDIGPDIESGSRLITQTVSARPESFASLEDAIAFRRDTSPITAARTPEDQRELALGVLKQARDGRWVWKMDPAYVEQRVKRGPPVRPASWPVLAKLACPAQVIWGTASDVLSEAQARKMVATLPKGELVPVPGVVHAPSLIEPPALAAIGRLLTATA